MTDEQFISLKAAADRAGRSIAGQLAYQAFQHDRKRRVVRGNRKPRRIDRSRGNWSALFDCEYDDLVPENTAEDKAWRHADEREKFERDSLEPYR